MDALNDVVIPVMDGYLAALNGRDSAGMRAAFHYPHYRFAGGRVVIYQGPEDYDFGVFDARTRADSWAYSEWDRREVIHASEAKVHADIQFTRYRGDEGTPASFERHNVSPRDTRHIHLRRSRCCVDQRHACGHGDAREER